MRRSFLSNAVRRLTIAGPREAASSLGGASGVAGSLLQPLHFLSPAAAAITPKPSAYGLSGSGFRSFSASAFSRAGGGLHDVLHKEYTQEMGQEPDASVGTPPNSFKVVDTPGAGELVLEQKKGSETISVSVEVMTAEFGPTDEAEDGDQEGEEEEDGTSLSFTVSVTRADRPGVLTFHCYTHDEDDCFEITDVLLEDDLKDVDSESYYSGPRFDEMDPQVLDAFHAYLRERGVDKSLVEYLEGATWDKEQKEYTRWLKRVGDFVR